MTAYNEDDFENAALEWFEQIGWARAYGPTISPGGSKPERDDFGQVLLLGRLASAVARLNPTLDEATVAQVVAVTRRAESADLVRENFRWHTFMKDGVPVEVRGDDGHTRHLRARIIDLRDAVNNDYLVVNQWRVVEATGQRRADIVGFVNGIPLALFELKRPSDEDATIQGAYNQVQTYKAEIPALLAPTALCVIADGSNARVGSLTATFEFYSRWRTVGNEEPAGDEEPQLKTLIHGMFDQDRILELVEFFIDWGDSSGKLNKRLARYSQYWGVRATVDSVVRASGDGGDRRGGIVFHGQG
jgi:type I restriction enzyme R subunit